MAPHICNYYCHPPSSHATNMVLTQPYSEADNLSLLSWMRETGQPVVDIEQVIPVTEVVDLEAWMRQYEDGKDFVMPPGTCYGIVVVARYPEREPYAVS